MYNPKIGFYQGQIGKDEMDRLILLKNRVKQPQHVRENSDIPIWQLLFSDEKAIKSLGNEITLIGGLVKKFDLLSGLMLQKLWLVESTFENVDTSKLPFVPHIDITRATKIMIYMSDVATEDGPMYIAKDVLPEDYESKRKLVGAKGENIISDLRLSFCPLIGSAGHFHIFDTNLPHYAGAPSPGGSRSIMRLDFVHSRQ